jgi:hypothetical protein
VRDILVRSGQANVNAWRKSSAATILTAQTTSVPQVWRSIDHRCMAWCRELVLTTNRALFDLVDTKNTGQIIESRQVRESVLRFYFERGVASSERPSGHLSFRDESLFAIELVENIDVLSISLFLNADRSREKLYLFNMNLVLGSFNFDSLFVYTNLNRRKSFVLCKSFFDSECKGFMDLASEYGRLIPPYVETERHLTLMTINVVDFRKKVLADKYQYMLVGLPKSDSSSKKLFFKFDFYLNEYRIDLNLNGKTSFQIKNTQSGLIFRRIYLPFLRHAWQSFDLNRHVDAENACDHYISMSLSKKPRAMSCLMVQFYEPVQLDQVEHLNEHVYHSQAIQTKSKNLTLRLTTESIGDTRLTPYIDLIQFELKHLLPAVEQKESTSGSIYKIELLVNYSAMLGQFVRFYAPCLPAFLVFIVQAYHAISLLSASRPGETAGRFFIMHTFNVSLKFHLSMSVLVATLIYILPGISFFDDIEELASARISFNFVIAFFLYWLACSILNLFACVLSCLVFGLNSAIFNRIASSQGNRAKSFTFPAIHLALTLILGCYVSTLALTSVFIFQFISLAQARSKHSSSHDDRHGLLYLEAKLVLTFLLIIFNGPGLVVWVKMQYVDELLSLTRMSSVLSDIGLVAGVASVCIHFLDFFLHEKLYLVQSSQLFSHTIRYFLVMNSFLTLVYSLSSFYRLQYFVLVHLASASIERLIQSKSQVDLKKD